MADRIQDRLMKMGTEEPAANPEPILRIPSAPQTAEAVGEDEEKDDLIKIALERDESLRDWADEQKRKIEERFGAKEKAIEKKQLIEQLAGAITQFGAAMQGQRTGVDLSNLQFLQTDFERQLDRLAERREVEEVGVERELGARRRLQDALAARRERRKEREEDKAIRREERAEDTELRREMQKKDEDLRIRLKQMDMVEKQRMAALKQRAAQLKAEEAEKRKGQPGISDSGKPQSDGQLLSEGFFERMRAANDGLKKLPARPTESPVRQRWIDFSRRAKGVPFVGGGFDGLSRLVGLDAVSVVDSDGKQHMTLAADFIRAKLRKESGAAISAEEWASEYETYFPIAGDDDKTIKLKEKLRDQAIDAMQTSTGRLGRPISVAGEVERKASPEREKEISTFEQARKMEEEMFPSVADLLFKAARSVIEDEDGE